MDSQDNLTCYFYPASFTFVKEEKRVKQYVVIRGPNKSRLNILGVLVGSKSYWDVSYSIHSSLGSRSGFPPDSFFNVYLGKNPSVKLRHGGKLSNEDICSARVCLEIMQEAFRNKNKFVISNLNPGGKFPEKTLEDIICAFKGCLDNS
jgi:hypothetical protein